MCFVVVVAFTYSLLLISDAQEPENEIKPLRWDFEAPIHDCTTNFSTKSPCRDMRICDEARASLKMKGNPVICGWMPKGVPRVCCGFPIALGEELAKKVAEEKVITRGCGLTRLSEAPSATEDKFLEIMDSLPPIDTSNPEKYDPPLDFSFQLVEPAGGRAAVEGVYPWMAAIFRGPTFWCGGTVLNNRHIISAAHCFVSSDVEPDASLYTVRLGSVYLNRGRRYKVSKIVVHEDYSFRAHYNDIAILTLEEEIADPTINRICLPDPTLAARNLTGERTTLLGWGQLGFGERRVPSLHVVKDIPVVSNYQCNEAYRNVRMSMLPRNVTDDFICAGLDEGGKDACQYDSGGPLLYDNNVNNLLRGHPNIPKVLIGIVSFGYSCAEPGMPGVYTRVSSYMDWILKNIADAYHENISISPN